jgi:hypothetical protein
VETFVYTAPGVAFPYHPKAGLSPLHNPFHIQIIRILITIFEKLNRYFLSNWRLAVLDLNKALWTLKPKPAVIPYLKAENAKGKHILIQPADPSNYLLADDLSDSLLSAHHKLPDGSFKPGRMVVETSPCNFQVWIHCKHPISLVQKRFLLQKLKSDPGADPNNRFGRCPGFRNRKEKYQNPQGFFPLAKLIWIDWNHQTMIPDAFYTPQAHQPPSLSHQPLLGGVCQSLSRNLYQKNNESETDFAYTLALIRKGFSDERIHSIILAERSNWNNHYGEIKQTQYINRTIRRAREIARNSV